MKQNSKRSCKNNTCQNKIIDGHKSNVKKKILSLLKKRQLLTRKRKKLNKKQHVHKIK
jgi:hypothetical protein